MSGKTKSENAIFCYTILLIQLQTQLAGYIPICVIEILSVLSLCSVCSWRKKQWRMTLCKPPAAFPQENFVKQYCVS